MKISVFGSGGWGTAVSMLLNDNGHEVTLWSAFEKEAQALRETRENPLLKGVRIPVAVKITADFDLAVSDIEVAVVATPSFAVRETAKRLKGRLPDDCLVVCISKGIEQDTSVRFSEILTEILEPKKAVVLLSGPTHAEEVSRKIPTACVAASTDYDMAVAVQKIFMNKNFRVYTSRDVIGVELGAALKNVIALAAGISDGLGCGDNTIALLATRGLSEIGSLCVALGGQKETLAGLAGIGDLIVTCTSRHSRNRRAGVYIGQGLKTKEAMEKVGAVVEGYYAAAAARQLSMKTGVEMPICSGVYDVLYNGKDPYDVMCELMSREGKPEQEDEDKSVKRWKRT